MGLFAKGYLLEGGTLERGHRDVCPGNAPPSAPQEHGIAGIPTTLFAIRARATENRGPPPGQEGKNPSTISRHQWANREDLAPSIDIPFFLAPREDCGSRTGIRSAATVRSLSKTVREDLPG